MTFDLREEGCQERQGTDLWIPAPSHQLQKNNDFVSSDRDYIHIEGPLDLSRAVNCQSVWNGQYYMWNKLWSGLWIEKKDGKDS